MVMTCPPLHLGTSHAEGRHSRQEKAAHHGFWKNLSVRIGCGRFRLLQRRGFRRGGACSFGTLPKSSPKRNQSRTEH